MQDIESSDLAALVTLDALLQESSVSGAARRLGLSTAAVSHALAKLRNRFDDPLLVRAGRTMVLTPRAAQLRVRVRDAVSVAAHVFEPTEAFDPRRVQQTIAISLTDYVLLVFGAALDDALSQQAPGLDLQVLPNAVDDAERLRDGRTDLAVGIYGDLPPELRARPIITDRLVCVVRRDHPTIRRKLTLRQFAALPHIQVAPRGQPGGYVDELLEARGLARRVSRAVPYFHVALEMVAQSDRILTISERIVAAVAQRLKLQVLEPPLPLEPFALSMVWHPRFDADPAHRWLRQQIVAVTTTMDGLAHGSPRRRLSATDPTTGRRGRATSRSRP